MTTNVAQPGACESHLSVLKLLRASNLVFELVSGAITQHPYFSASAEDCRLLTQIMLLNEFAVSVLNLVVNAFISWPSVLYLFY